MTRILEPLTPFRDRMTVITGLICDKANANGDGPGDHWSADSCRLDDQCGSRAHLQDAPHRRLVFHGFVIEPPPLPPPPA